MIVHEARMQSVFTSVLLWSTVLALYPDTRNIEIPEAVAQQFCQLELQGKALDGRSSHMLWELTTGEEPLMGASEIASTCSVVKVVQRTSSAAVVTVAYHVHGKLVEGADGSRRLIKSDKVEKAQFRMVLLDGHWKIIRKNLTYLPLHASAKAWAAHFQKLIEPDPTKRTGIDHELEKVVEQLNKM